jgi:hypothetical protein
MPPDWKVGEMSQPEFFRWLRCNLLDGTPAVGVDPDPTEARYVDILRFLAEAEGGGTDAEGMN